VLLFGQMDSEIVLSDYIRTVCLPKEADSNGSKYEQRSVTLTGWGLLSREKFQTDGILRQVPLTVYSQR